MERWEDGRLDYEPEELRELEERRREKEPGPPDEPGPLRDALRERDLGWLENIDL